MHTTPVTITYLEMHSVKQLRAKHCPDARFRIAEATTNQWKLNRFLYDLVGSDWNWTEKSRWSETQWRAYADSTALRTFTATYDGSIAGYYELRCGGDQEVEIAIFGIAPEFTGRGFGGAMLTHALLKAWEMEPARVWLHTCTLDHPAALPNYLARGMSIYRTEEQGSNGS